MRYFVLTATITCDGFEIPHQVYVTKQEGEGDLPHSAAIALIAENEDAEVTGEDQCENLDRCHLFTLNGVAQISAEKYLSLASLVNVV